MASELAMDLERLRENLEDIGTPPGSDQIKALEAKLGVKLPVELIQLLKEINGGRFTNIAVFRSPENHLDVQIRGLLRIQDGHESDLASFTTLIGDHDLDCSLNLPIFYTFSSNLFVLGTNDHRIKFWSSDHDALTDLGMSLAGFLDSLEFSDPNSEFERACRDLSFDQICKQPWFAEKSGEICTCAAMMGNLNLVADCLENHMPAGITMRAAAMNGQAGILDHLIGRGWNINEADENGRTILDWVSWKPAYFEIVRARGGKLGKET